MPRIVTARSNAVRLEAAAAWLAARPEPEVLVLAPTRRAADDLARTFAAGGGRLGVHRATLVQLAAELAAPALVLGSREVPPVAGGAGAAPSLAPIGGLGALALTSRAVHQTLAEGPLEYFGPVARTPGFAQALARTLSELRLEGIGPGELRAHGRPPSRDLARLLDHLTRALAEARVTDLARLLELAAAAAAGDHRYAGMPVLLADVAPGSRRAESFLGALGRAAPDVLATLPTDHELGLAALARALQAPAEALERDAASAGEGALAAAAAPPAEVAGAAAGARALDRARRWVFAATPPAAPTPTPLPAGPEPATSGAAAGTTSTPATPGRAGGSDDQAPDRGWSRASGQAAADPPAAAPTDDSLELFSAPGEGRECVEIARRILRAAGSGVRLDRIAILLRDPDRYQPLVEESLKRARVPAFYTAGTVRPDPSGRALLALLACTAEGLSASRFAEYLSLGQVPPLQDGAPPRRPVVWAPPQDEAQLAFQTLELAPDTSAPAEESDGDPVIAGTLQAPASWERLLVDAAVIGGHDRWARRLAGLEREIAIQLDALGGADSAEREHLERHRSRLGHLARFALPLVSRLAALPRAASWGEWLEALGALAATALSAPASVAAVLAELRPMADVGPVDLDEVREVLLERLTLLRAEPPERRYGKVFVGKIDEAAARTFHLVFLPGMAEGVFPKKKNEDPLLLDAARSTLAPHLLVQAHRSAEERLLLHLALGAAEGRLVASYPRMDLAEGRPRVPSFYALDLLRAAEGRLPDLRTLEKRAEAAAHARLGWPAPRLPEDAIDDAEYDLSILEGEVRPGQARYMLLANPHLDRALRARAARWRRSWRPADGFVAISPETRRLIAEERPAARAHAATDLERLAACPYRFYLKAIARLRPRERTGRVEALDPRTRGVLFHDAQFELFTALAAAGLLPMRAEREPEILAHLGEVVARLQARYADDLAPAIPPVFAREVAALEKDLAGWVRHAIEDGGGWTPIHAELAFGAPRRTRQDPASREAPAAIAGGYQLRGSIDLIEAGAGGAELRVTDFKTGKRPEPGTSRTRLTPIRHVGHGEHLQPLLYAIAAEAVLGRTVRVSRLHFATAREGYSAVEIEVDDAARRTAIDTLRLLDDIVQEGFLPPAPRPGACEGCDYRSVCGPLEERRIGHKDPEPLDRLFRLRSLP